MLHLSGSAANMDVENAIRDFLEQDAIFDRIENRSSHREHLVRPISLRIRGNDEEIEGFSRNVSASGIGLLTKSEIAERSIAVLEIERLKGPSAKFLAESRWCRPYGANWRISGWQFINLHR